VGKGEREKERERERERERVEAPMPPVRACPQRPHLLKFPQLPSSAVQAGHQAFNTTHDFCRVRGIKIQTITTWEE
jgi:hypothetical protein